jgi:hypothetical protein
MLWRKALSPSSFVIGSETQAEFAAFHTGLEIWDCQIEQVLFRVVENAEMGPLGHVTRRGMPVRRGAKS